MTAKLCSKQNSILTSYSVLGKKNEWTPLGNRTFLKGLIVLLKANTFILFCILVLQSSWLAQQQTSQENTPLKNWIKSSLDNHQNLLFFWFVCCLFIMWSQWVSVFIHSLQSGEVYSFNLLIIFRILWNASRTEKVNKFYLFLPSGPSFSDLSSWPFSVAELFQSTLNALFSEILQVIISSTSVLPSNIWSSFQSRWTGHICHNPTQLNPKLGRPYFPLINQNHRNHRNRPPLFLSSYTTKLDQIQYATLFQPN